MDDPIKRAAGAGADQKLLKVGLIGTAVAALCCFTPILVVLLGILGAAAAIAWLDMILLPALALFAAITLYALWRTFAS